MWGRTHTGPDASAGSFANYIGKQGKVCVVMQTIEHMQTIYRKHGFTDYLQSIAPRSLFPELSIPDDSDLYVDTVYKFLKEN